MKPFPFLLMVMWGALAYYTGRVVFDHGFNLFPIFFGDIALWNWPGQFNLDFLMMLFLSGCWTAWRNRLSPPGIALAILAFFGGAGFLLPYLTYLSWRHDGDTAAILTGTKRKSETL